jgi:hypothetical protein
LPDPINQETHVNTGTCSSTGVAFSSCPGLSQSLTAAGVYSCNGHIHFTTAPTASNGAGIRLQTADTLTVNTLMFNAYAMNGFTAAPVAGGTATALASTAFASTVAMTDIYMSAAINVNAAGTLVVQFDENVQSGTIAATAGNARWNCHRVS